MTNILEASGDFEKKILRDEIERLTNEVTKLQILLKEAGVIVDTSMISDEEAICVKEIAKIRRLSDDSQLTLDLDTVQKLEKLQKSLKIARGEDIRVKKKTKTSEMSADDLMQALKE